jgi:hypothetical protein
MIILVATHRRDVIDEPPINSSSVMTSYEPAGNSRSMLAIRNGYLKTTVSHRDRTAVIVILAHWLRDAAIAATFVDVCQCRKPQFALITLTGRRTSEDVLRNLQTVGGCEHSG